MTKEDFKVGSTYNIVYSSNNYMSGKKETILILQVFPEIKFVILYNQSANMYCGDLRSNIITAGFKSFEQDQITEVFDEKDFIKKSEIVTIDDAINRGLITVSELESIFDDQSKKCIIISPVIGYDSGKMYIKINVEGKDQINPYLQSIYIKWNSFKEMEASIKRFVPNAWFM